MSPAFRGVYFARNSCSQNRFQHSSFKTGTNNWTYWEYPLSELGSIFLIKHRWFIMCSHGRHIWHIKQFQQKILGCQKEVSCDFTTKIFCYCSEQSGKFYAQLLNSKILTLVNSHSLFFWVYSKPTVSTIVLPWDKSLRITSEPKNNGVSIATSMLWLQSFICVSLVLYTRPQHRFWEPKVPTRPVEALPGQGGLHGTAILTGVHSFQHHWIFLDKDCLDKALGILCLSQSYC